MMRVFKWLGTACLIGIVLGGCGVKESAESGGELGKAPVDQAQESAEELASNSPDQPLLSIEPNEPDAATVPASAVSPDGRYRIETYGENRGVTAGGLYPVEGIRLVNASSDEEIWSMTGYYTQAFLWSSDSRYVSVSYEARTWGGAVIVDAEDGSVIDLPDVEALRQRWGGDTSVDEARPDPYLQVTEWLDPAQVTVSFIWNGQDGSAYSGTYVFDVESREMVELRKF